MATEMRLWEVSTKKTIYGRGAFVAGQEEDEEEASTQATGAQKPTKKSKRKRDTTTGGGQPSKKNNNGQCRGCGQAHWWKKCWIIFLELSRGAKPTPDL